MQEQLSDILLMERVASGDQLSFRVFVVRHLPKAHAIAMRLLHNHADAEEAVQDAFDKVWVNAARYNPAKAAVGTWFYRILTNTCLNMARKKPPESVTLDVIEEVVADEEKRQDERLMAHQEVLRVRVAVQSLSERQRLAVVLCYFEDMTNPEAAQVMGLHVKALEGLLVRARKILREILHA